MKISDGPLSGLTPTEKAAGNIIKPAKMAIAESTHYYDNGEDAYYMILKVK